MRCDLWCKEEDGRESWVELKLCVTNYAQGFTGRVSARPITNQISDINADAIKLGNISTSRANRHIFLLAYPMPFDYLTKPEWNAHLARLRFDGKVVDESFAVMVERAAKAAYVLGYKVGI